MFREWAQTVIDNGAFLFQKLTQAVIDNAAFLFEKLAVVAVSIFGLRHIVAKLGLWPKRWWWANWIYGEPQLPDRDAFRIRLLHRLENSHGKLVVLVSKFLRKSTEELEYGETTKTYSHYYIDTMEAAQDEANLNVMVDLLRELLRKNGCPKHPTNPDFVIVPKGGNPLLGREFAERIDAFPILAKAREDSAYVKAADRRARLRINFEGVERMLQLEQRMRAEGKQLYGICVDCNVAGGRGVREAMESFNELREALGLSIRKVEAVYILFRATNEKPDTAEFERSFSDKGFTLYRYLDFSEDAKKHLEELQLPDNYSTAANEKVTGYLRELSNNDLLKGT